ncbi:hypothetical protein [Psychrobacillus sp. FJAT-21963]|uniref:hypothetical protein n=1 Tax=Psychrobacillus sp. FJAT-21963 TaxID=1712028 RepID=UPI0006F7B6A1|nr:hypothetical protein [Psychrobacillus sp. FJAT-21963]KQL33662.1 hypothetical protein AN959_16155 [Psychrobacillus sp. FJAT-21963]
MLREIDKIEGDGNMERKFSNFSIILIVVGIFVAYMAFPPINIDILGWWGIFIGFCIYLTGIVLGICAFFKKEKGFMKYISLLSISLGVLFSAFLYAIVGKI